ncbi:MAG: hypothetical protein LBM93_04905 [Oscillospiraceae bacterium]|jgi:SpoVK/Ycf46/Vps4 family AAA+-type ATPase|nr:hypothetical protein [Oscillospiraceae bacterium]
MRAGRLDEKFHIPLPDYEARKQILLNNFKEIPLEDGIDFDDLAAKTDGFNGADMAEFCYRCTDNAFERSVQENSKTGDDIVTKSDIEKTLSSFHSSVQKQDIEKLENFKSQYDS